MTPFHEKYYCKNMADIIIPLSTPVFNGSINNIIYINKGRMIIYIYISNI